MGYLSNDAPHNNKVKRYQYSIRHDLGFTIPSSISLRLPSPSMPNKSVLCAAVNA